MSSQQKRSILITGCSEGGSGHALALEFASHGLRVFATARSTKSLTKLEAKGIETLPLDVTKRESILALRDEIEKRTGGKLDILFNNAGMMYEAPAIEASPERVRTMFDTNVFGLFDMVSVFTPLLLAAASDSHHPPTIINVASILARLPYAFSAAYNASKAAVSSYSDTLRLELAPLGIKVVTLFMGEVSTGLMSADNISFGSDSLYAGVEERVKERSRQHAKSSVKPEEFAKRVVDHVLVKKPQIGTGEYLWEGSNASTIWALDAVGHRKIFDGVVKGAVGLNKPEVVKSILDKAESKVKRGA
ncbi:hypothetical protein B0J12DRAFT_761356 [Macrophomina phaseolina]|uniref:Short-chain dehydrogenase/reductase SDR n=1 Tax=Macrophomina phaseolina TaxID=35725 RepID=A0ABQ8G5D1_9PEZI|nr:hypothetical protein B0J12DRAFT_761356 [Macrophomina phaseolina]